MKSYHAKASDIEKKWHIIDLEGKVLGRAAAHIAHLLRGKHKPTYTQSIDTGDFVVVVNADKVKMTGRKLENKMYYKHTGHMGGIREINAQDLLAKNPAEVINRAVKGMLPSGPLARAQMKKLKVYAGSEHPHAAQKPEVYSAI